MGGASELAGVERALQGIGAMLEADGYSLKVDAYSAGRLRLVVEAGPDACEDCLVPPETMETIVSQALGDDIDLAEVELVYPAGSDAAAQRGSAHP